MSHAFCEEAIDYPIIHTGNILVGYDVVSFRAYVVRPGDKWGNKSERQFEETAHLFANASDEAIAHALTKAWATANHEREHGL